MADQTIISIYCRSFIFLSENFCISEHNAAKSLQYTTIEFLEMNNVLFFYELLFDWDAREKNFHDPESFKPKTFYVPGSLMKNLQTLSNMKNWIRTHFVSRPRAKIKKWWTTIPGFHLSYDSLESETSKIGP